MKPFFKTLRPTFDAQAVRDTIQRALSSAGLTGTVPAPLVHTAPAGGPPAAGHLERHRFTHPAGTLAYALHRPPQALDTPAPMLVMLHGCTQSADDFAAGTQMNRLADEHGFLVLYPEQAAQANPGRCWNWFKPQDQRRGAGEPALIAALVEQVAAQHGVDRRRVFVAGLSAGAAMAVVLGQTYPERFAAIGVHSGLPYRSAHDVPSALAAMKGGAGIPSAGAGNEHAVPVIVFHGDRDTTVQQRNADQIVRQALAAHGAAAGAAPLQPREWTATAPGGRRYTRSVHADAAGRAQVEVWTLHGAGHAWSGGDARGSYTDASGPDASAAMVRFFLAQPRVGAV